MRQLTDTRTHTHTRARAPHTFTYLENVDGFFLFGPAQVWIKLHFGRTAVWVQQPSLPVYVKRFQVFDSCSIHSCVYASVWMRTRVCVNVCMCAVVFQYAIHMCVCMCCRDLFFIFLLFLVLSLWFSCFRFTSHSKWLYICPFTYAISSVFDCFGI